MTNWIHTSDQNSNAAFISSSQSGRIRLLLCAFDDSGLFVVTGLHISLSIYIMTSIFWSDIKMEVPKF